MLAATRNNETRVQASVQASIHPKSVQQLGGRMGMGHGARMANDSGKDSSKEKDQARERGHGHSVSHESSEIRQCTEENGKSTVRRCFYATFYY
jgi:hypothetical protein